MLLALSCKYYITGDTDPFIEVFCTALLFFSQAFCPIREVPRYYAHESPMEAFTIRDKVRGIIIGSTGDKLMISLRSDALPPDKDKDIKIVSDYLQVQTE